MLPRHREGTNGGAATAKIEDNINQARTAFVTAGIAVLRGGVPIHVNGLSKEIDAEIANTAATALSPSPVTAQRR
jgi:glc operon protein GlcG